MEKTTNYYEEFPHDLMPLQDLADKHCFSYNFLYKLAMEEGAIRVFFRGVWKLSESEVLDFCKNKKKNKLGKLKNYKGVIS